jgi:cytochrome c556
MPDLISPPISLPILFSIPSLRADYNPRRVDDSTSTRWFSQRQNAQASHRPNLAYCEDTMNITVRTLTLTTLLFGLLAACSKAPPPPPFKAVNDMKQLMNRVIDPAAIALWAAVGSVSTKDGEEKIAPKTDEDWAAARNNAAIVAEAGNLLMMEGRAVDRDAWMIAARGLIDQAEVAMKAADAKDADALFTANSDVFLACTECHKTYAIGAQKAATK